MTTLHLLIMTLFVFASYLCIASFLFGALPSISDSFYRFEEQKRGHGYLFTAWCFVIGFASMTLILEASAGKWFQFLGFIAGAGLCLVGAAPRFRTLEKRIHTVAALLCGIPAVAWCLLTGHWAIVLLSFGMCLLLCAALKKKNPVFWVETAAFAATYATLMTAM
jgi:hypothetical protein